MLHQEPPSVTITSVGQTGGITANAVHVSGNVNVGNNLLDNDDKKNARWVRYSVYVGVVALVIAFLAWRYPITEEKKMTNNNSSTPVTNITSYNQSGGITAHTVNVTEPPLPVVSATTIASIKACNPDNKPIAILTALQDARTIQVAANLADELKKSGMSAIFNAGITVGIQPFKGLRCREEGQRIVLFVGVV